MELHVLCAQEMKSGCEFETKESLMRKADESGLPNRPMRNPANSMAKNPAERYYDGWSSMTKVKHG